MHSKTVSLLEVIGEGWKKLSCPISELRLDIVLNCGQSFRWRRLSPGIWASVLNRRVWVLSQNETELLYKVYTSSSSPTNLSSSNSSSPVPKVEPKTDDEAELRDYFQLDLCNLSDLYPKWRVVDPHFDACCDQFRGVRTLRQDPVENLFSFICSSNNNISRISSMVQNLCLHFGDDTGVVIEGEKKEVFYNFPPVARLANSAVDEKLRGLGFGYRAKFIQSSAQYILDNGGEPWLFSLRQKNYLEAKTALLSLCGVGAKVADCVCLMSLDKNGAVPVDTHVLQIAQKYLKAGISGRAINTKADLKDSEAAVAVKEEVAENSSETNKRSQPKSAYSKSDSTTDSVSLSTLMSSMKTLTPRVYDAIADYFRSIWGTEFAGWAQSVVFAADLKAFSKEKSSTVKAEKTLVQKKKIVKVEKTEVPKKKKRW